MCFRKLFKCLFCCKKRKEGGLNESTFYEYIDSLPVFHRSNLGEVKEGVSFTITGYILAQCERFSINFVIENTTRDIALHLNPRLPQNYIVRNTKANDVWGREEVTSALPFTLHRGSKFAIQVLITDACYMISVNGHHFAEYSHRLPYKAVKTIEVKGDVDNIDLVTSEVACYPERLCHSFKANKIHVSTAAAKNVAQIQNEDSAEKDEVDSANIPSDWRIIRMPHVHQSSPTAEAGLLLPYFGEFPAKSLIVGRCLKIEGRAKLLPHSFYINLQQGQHNWPHPIIPFHFNPRFSKQGGAIGKAIVCRNAWYNGSWATEERSELDTDFRPGKTFCLVISCGTAGFEVYLNNKLITEFSYRVGPEIIDTVYIQGDIKLWSVSLDTMASISRGSPQIYQNPGYTEEN